MRKPENCPQCGYQLTGPRCHECGGAGYVPTRAGELVPCKSCVRRARIAREQREQARREPAPF
jgi:hypothetical protein